MKPVAVVNLSMIAADDNTFLEDLERAGYTVVQCDDGPNVHFNNPAADQRERIATAAFGALIRNNDLHYTDGVEAGLLSHDIVGSAVVLADLLIKELNK